jgi:CBS domain-containing protein
MRVDSAMTRDVVTCGPTDTLARAAQLMAERDCGAVPVCDQGALVGLLTDRDVCLTAYKQGRPLHEIVVQDAMTRDVVTCMPSEEVEQALHKMRQRRVRRVPVTHSGKVVGILSLNDVALLLGDTSGPHAGESVSAEQIARALADVSAHRTPVVREA